MDCLLLVFPRMPDFMPRFLRADRSQCQLIPLDAQDICFCPLSHTHTLEVTKEQAHIKKKKKKKLLTI